MAELAREYDCGEATIWWDCNSPKALRAHLFWPWQLAPPGPNSPIARGPVGFRRRCKKFQKPRRQLSMLGGMNMSPHSTRRDLQFQ